MNEFNYGYGACPTQSWRETALGAPENVYRIPKKHAPQTITEAAALAFYFTRAFGDEKWSIHWYAAVRRAVERLGGQQPTRSVE